MLFTYSYSTGVYARVVDCFKVFIRWGQNTGVFAEVYNIDIFNEYFKEVHAHFGCLRYCYVETPK